MLEGRPVNTPGACVTCVIEGSRPILAEIQALVTPSSFNMPRRNSNGVDYNRAMMLLAVLEKRTGYKVNSCDAYINVIADSNNVPEKLLQSLEWECPKMTRIIPKAYRTSISDHFLFLIQIPHPASLNLLHPVSSLPLSHYPVPDPAALHRKAPRIPANDPEYNESPQRTLVFCI